MRIIIDSPQFAEAIQTAEWVVEVEGLDEVLAAGEVLRQYFEDSISRIKLALEEMYEEFSRIAMSINAAIKNLPSQIPEDNFSEYVVENIDLFDDDFVKHLYRPKQINWSAALQKVADSQEEDIEKLIKRGQEK